jgi:DnaK suppressor protein
MNIDTLKRRLLERKAELLRSTSSLEERADLPSFSNHPADLASDASGDELSLSLLESETRELREVWGALDRLRRGDYGRCEDCEQDIDPARLEAMPEARLCRECKLQEERISA